MYFFSFLMAGIFPGRKQTRQGRQQPLHALLSRHVHSSRPAPQRDQLCAAGLCPAEGERRALLGADTLAPFSCPCVHPPKTGLGQKRVNTFTHRGVSAGTATPAVGPATCLRTELSAGRSREAGAEPVSLVHRAQGGGVGLAHSETRGE